MTITYEWAIETVAPASGVDAETGERWNCFHDDDRDIIDVDHRDILLDFGIERVISALNEEAEDAEGTTTRVVLVRDVHQNDDLVFRSWAYVKDGKLPDHFYDANEAPTAPVPARFKTELATDIRPDGPKPMTGEQLQAARKAAAERYTAIAMQYVPEGYTVEYRKSLSGRCHYGPLKIEAPRPVTRRALYIFLHECAHAHLHQPIYAASPAKYRKLPKHVVEMQAEQWAHSKMREHGVAVPRKSTKSAKRYVAKKIRHALRRGAKRIDPEARRFAR